MSGENGDLLFGLLTELAETLSGERRPTVPVFVDSFLDAVESDLTTLYYALLSPEIDPKAAAQTVYGLRRRISSARDVCEMIPDLAVPTPNKASASASKAEKKR